MNYMQLIGNPAKRRRKHRAKSRRRASPKQRAARARFAAMARSRSHRRHAPAIAANPVRSRRRRHVVHVRSRRRRNPIRVGASMRGIGGLFRSAATGATGALLNDIAYGFAAPFLPAALTAPAATGAPNYMYSVGKSATAVLLGMALRKVPGVGAKAAQMTEGALTVTLHDLLKQMVVSFGVAIPMGDPMLERIAPPSPNSQRLKMYPGGATLKMYPGGGGTSMAAREGVNK